MKQTHYTEMREYPGMTVTYRAWRCKRCGELHRSPHTGRMKLSMAVFMERLEKCDEIPTLQCQDTVR